MAGQSSNILDKTVVQEAIELFRKNRFIDCSSLCTFDVLLIELVLPGSVDGIMDERWVDTVNVVPRGSERHFAGLDAGTLGELQFLNIQSGR